MDVTHPPSFFFFKIPMSAIEKGEHGTHAQQAQTAIQKK
jgi:hypothetical protein